MRKANIAQASAIIPCTNDELTNLDIALDALEINPSIKVVMRMFDPDLARRVEKGFGIHNAFSTSALAAPVFAAAAMDVSIKSSFYVGQDLLNLSEVIVQPGSQIAGWSVEKLEIELDINVVFYQYDQITDLHPAPDRILFSGTKLLVLASLDKLARLKRMQTGVSSA